MFVCTITKHRNRTSKYPKPKCNGEWFYGIVLNTLVSFLGSIKVWTSKSRLRVVPIFPQG